MRSAETEPLLAVTGAVRHLGGIAAVNGATLAVAEGSITALVGPNGAGKTSLFHLVAGTLRPETGTIRFGGHSIGGRPAPSIARLGLRRTFQTPRPFRGLRVLENVMVGCEPNLGERLWRVFASPLRVRGREAEVEALSREMLAVVGLEAHADKLAGTLSGGQLKLLELARALVAEPRLILLDEPMAGVNAALGEQILEHMLAFRERRGTTFFVIEHDLDFVTRASDHVIVMNEGAVIAEGTAKAMWANERVVEAYVGQRP